MKRLLTLILVCNTTYSFSQELDSFKKISEELKNGKSIRLVINFDNCLPHAPISDLVAYTEAKAVMIQSDHLQFANSHLTTNNPLFPTVLENVTYSISEDNKVKLATKVIALPDYNVIESRVTECKLDKNSVRVYAKDK